jgi:hypothetical protein
MTPQLLRFLDEALLRADCVTLRRTNTHYVIRIQFNEDRYYEFFDDESIENALIKAIERKSYIL